MSTSDELLQAELRSAIEQHDPVPPAAVEAARAAFAWRTFDAEVAELLFDSARDDVIAAVRGSGSDRLLSFEGDELAVELGVTGLGEQRTLTGQIDPPARMSVEVRSLEGSTMLETDGLGRFSFGIATGPVSLRVLRGDGPPLQTPWTLI